MIGLAEGYLGKSFSRTRLFQYAIVIDFDARAFIKDNVAAREFKCILWSQIL